MTRADIIELTLVCLITVFIAYGILENLGNKK